jgi:heme a synthase
MKPSLGAAEIRMNGPDGLAADAMEAGTRIVGRWLLVCALLVLVMVLLGGITRLTDSGLSIMEWRPLMGVLPPLSQAEWERVFALYREIAEYRHVNAGMELAQFKEIFWWEYLHRLWGRLIALAFLLPFLWFLGRGLIRKNQAGRFVALFVLGALQGFLGWFMVASGFEERIDVSQYRLVMHLLLALGIFGFLLWSALDLLQPKTPNRPPARTDGFRYHAYVLTGLIALEIALGGLVAGTDAGLLYNDFPLMNGSFVPPDLMAQSPWWRNLGENPAMVQFQHRLLAGLTAIMGVWLVARLHLSDAGQAIKRRAGLLLAALIAQLGLGIATLMLVVPMPLAVLHQLGAFLLFGAGLYLAHGFVRKGKTA